MTPPVAVVDDSRRCGPAAIRAFAGASATGVVAIDLAVEVVVDAVGTLRSPKLRRGTRVDASGDDRAESNRWFGRLAVSDAGRVGGAAMAGELTDEPGFEADGGDAAVSGTGVGCASRGRLGDVSMGRYIVSVALGGHTSAHRIVVVDTPGRTVQVDHVELQPAP